MWDGGVLCRQRSCSGRVRRWDETVTRAWRTLIIRRARVHGAGYEGAQPVAEHQESRGIHIVLTNRLLRTAAPITLAALALTSCGPQEDSGQAAPKKGTFAEPLALRTPADVSDTHFPKNEKSRLSVTPVSVVKGNKPSRSRLNHPQPPLGPSRPAPAPRARAHSRVRA